MPDGIFDPDADQNKFEYWMRDAAPRKVYSILFTPRSGSSWLTSILTQAQTMGTPEEWFNPQLMPSSSRSKGARNLDQFVEVISRHQQHGNVFGFEVTYHQLKAVFESETDFMSRFGEAVFFWLIRKDIVAQGISLDKMVQTNVSHSAVNEDDDIKSGDASYRYDSDRIKKWIRHIRAAEIGTEKMVSDHGLSPLRLSYEGITSMGERKVVALFSSRLNVPNKKIPDISSGHRKIGTSKNNLFADRFRAENKDFLAELEADRAEMLSYHI